MENGLAPRPRIGGSDPDLGGRIAGALDALRRDDAALLVRDAHEQAITARLADHVRQRCAGWDIDAEYNRDGHAVKKANGVIVVPDVIVHHRGTPDNLLVIEVKKSNNTKMADLEKLRAFRSSHLAYRHAHFIKFTVGAPPAVEKVEWV